MGARDLDSTFLEEITPETTRAIRRALRAGVKPLSVEAPVSLSEWAAQHFYLSAESSQRQERWEAYPYQPGIMDAMGNDLVEEVDVMKSARVGYTKMLLACIAYDAEHKRRNQAIWQPTDADSDDFTKTELEPMLRDVKVMQTVFPSFMAKSKDNTLQHKKFLGSMLHLRGGKAAKNFRRITIGSAKLDELDGFDQQIEHSSDPFTLAFKRLEGATFPKIIAGTTPRIKGLSHIEGRTSAAQARMRYMVDCPHCGVEHPLSWGEKWRDSDEDVRHGFKIVDDDPETAHHVCPHCLGVTHQADYLRAWTRGSWVSECSNWRYGQDCVWRDGRGMPCRPPRHVAFRIWTAYSPQATWVSIARQYVEALDKARIGDKAPMAGFVNETLGETWEDADAERIETHVLQKRAERYRLGTVPQGGLFLVAGVDVQGNRFEVTVYAVGRKEELWLVDYQVIEANPALDSEWIEKLEPALLRTYPHASGQQLAIEATGIDMMGHFTHQGYRYTATRARRNVFGVRGDPKPGKDIVRKPTLRAIKTNGKTDRRGAKLWYVGADTAKDLLFGRLQLVAKGPGYVHFSDELPAQFFAGLTCESRVPVRSAAGMEFRWVNVHRRRNEPLDCTVYALWCMYKLDLKERDFVQREELLRPSLFSMPVDLPAEPSEPSGMADVVDVVDVVAAGPTAPAPAPAVVPAARKPEAPMQSVVSAPTEAVRLSSGRISLGGGGRFKR